MRNKTSCFICRREDFKYLFTSKGYQIIECQNCNFKQVALVPSFEYLEKLYFDLHLSHTKFRDSSAAFKENCSRLMLLKKHCFEGGIVLDAGCATGDFLAVSKSNFSVYGTDISHAAIDAAKLRFPDLSDRLTVVNLDQFRGDWPQFDAICLWDVIEHVSDPIKVCNVLMGFLKPGGKLLISTPDMDSMTSRLMRQHWAFMIPPLHLGFFSTRVFEYIFSKIIPAKIIDFKTRGKWTSLGFILYKIKQINRYLMPNSLLDLLGKSSVGKLNLYVPTNDILYIVIEKTNK